MPNTKVLHNGAPKSLTFSKITHSIQLIIHGQCVFLFSSTGACTLTFLTKDNSDGLGVSFADNVVVERISNSNKYDSQIAKTGGITSKSGAYYWFSLDSQNQRFYAGVGEPRVETACYMYQFDAGDKLWEANKVFLESIVYLRLSETVTPLRLLKDPITLAVPLFVKSTSELTMDDVAGTTYLPWSQLSAAGQTMYNCISGDKFVLNTPDFPDFSDAIEYSIRTPELWCNNRLKEKATEFGSDPLETYLRITLGQNNGESPGIPYVMEIWPVNHYSPIHNHSGASAVIRVLHGSIHVSLYPYLCNDASGVEPFGTQDFTKNDVTWISPTLNQIHMLKNLATNTETCITIQCYMYEVSDKEHYDYFDYLGTKNVKHQYEPDSDKDYLAFKEKMRAEWNARLAVPQVAVVPQVHSSRSCFGCFRIKN